MSESVYRKLDFHADLRVYVRGDSKIKSWGGWPDDVGEILEAWNRSRRLRFDYTKMFKCADCRVFVDPVGSTACRLDGDLVCDDCIIVRVRKYGILGRAETELEKTKRFLRGAIRKIERYRHNALTERVYVARLKTTGEAFADAYEAASVSDAEGLLVAVSPAEARKLWETTDDAYDAFRAALRGR